MISIRFQCDECQGWSFSREPEELNGLVMTMNVIRLLPKGWTWRKGSENMQHFCSARCKNLFESWLAQADQTFVKKLK